MKILVRVSFSLSSFQHLLSSSLGPDIVFRNRNTKRKIITSSLPSRSSLVGEGSCMVKSPHAMWKALRERVGCTLDPTSGGPRRLLWGANAEFNSGDQLKIARWKLRHGESSERHSSYWYKQVQWQEPPQRPRRVCASAWRPSGRRVTRNEAGKDHGCNAKKLGLLSLGQWGASLSKWQPVSSKRVMSERF